MRLYFYLSTLMRPASRYHVICGLILVGFSYLALINLDYVRLWGDEAIQAFIARNFVNTGEPVVFDGRNFFSNDSTGGTGDIAPNLQHRHPQLIYYIGALGLWLFGDHDWSGRLLSALLGIASMILFWRILLREFTGRPLLICTALAIACFAPITLLHVRQFQYYAASLFLNLLVFYFYLLYLQRRKLWQVAAMTLTATLAFHVHYLISAAFIITMAVVHLLFRAPIFNRRDWLLFIAAGCLWAGGAWLYFYLTDYLSLTSEYYSNFYRHAFIKRHLILIWSHLRALNENDILPWTVTLWLLGYGIFRMRIVKRAAANISWRAAIRRLGQEKKIQYGVITIIYTIVIGILTVFPAIEWAQARYLLIITPFAAIVCAAAIEALARVTTIAWSLLLLAVMLFSNLLGAPFLHHRHYGNTPLFTLPSLMREIHNPYPNGIDASVRYLAKHAKQDDIVLSVPYSYGHPLRYYLGDRLFICCMISARSPLYQQFQNYPYLLSEAAKPDWIISYGRALQAPHLAQLQHIGNYQLYTVLPVFETGFSLYRPEPVYHLYSHSLKEYANAMQQVYIYRYQPIAE